jgi:xanthine/uracil permease
MNFKLTKIKVIVSIIIPILFWIWLFSKNFSNVSSKIFLQFLQIHDGGNLFSLGNIILFLIEVFVVYLIFSLIQKKKKAR